MNFMVFPRTVIDPRAYLTCLLFFLAGPIGGGNDWQRRAVLLLRQLSPNCVIVSPCWYDDSHPLMRYRITGDDEAIKKTVPWERHYLEAAAWRSNRGCILFWLPEESSEFPRTDGKPYALDTRRELREWSEDVKENPHTRLVVGGEPGFAGLGEVRKSFAQSLGRPFDISSSLEDTVARAVQVAEQNCF